MRAQYVLIAALLVPGAVQAQQLYKCVQSNGRVVYQDSPCETTAKQSTLRGPEATVPSPAAAPADAKAGAAAPSASVDAVVEVLSGWQACANDLPGWAIRYAAQYNEWRSRNQVGIGAFNANAAAQQRVKDNLEKAQANSPTDERGRVDRAAGCDASVAGWFGPAKS